MFLMGNSYEAGAEEETRQAIIAAEAAKAAGVGHLIYSSVADANKKTGIPHFESKYLVEKHVAGLGIPYTISAPVAFMENIVAPWSIGALRQGTHAFAMPPRQQRSAGCRTDAPARFRANRASARRRGDVQCFHLGLLFSLQNSFSSESMAVGDPPCRFYCGRRLP
jgi:uncharacterized protein YbjT (DUF2867 family)